jgi:hypothetical protein
MIIYRDVVLNRKSCSRSGFRLRKTVFDRRDSFCSCIFLPSTQGKKSIDVQLSQIVVDLSSVRYLIRFDIFLSLDGFRIRINKRIHDVVIVDDHATTCKYLPMIAQCFSIGLAKRKTVFKHYRVHPCNLYRNACAWLSLLEICCRNIQRNTSVRVPTVPNENNVLNGLSFDRSKSCTNFRARGFYVFTNAPKLQNEQTEGRKAFLLPR